MTDRDDTHNTAPLPWRLMVLALAGALTPPEPVRLGPLLRHRGKAEPIVVVLPFAARWLAPHGVGAHRALWADR